MDNIRICSQNNLFAPLKLSGLQHLFVLDIVKKYFGDNITIKNNATKSKPLRVIRNSLSHDRLNNVHTKILSRRCRITFFKHVVDSIQ